MYLRSRQKNRAVSASKLRFSESSLQAIVGNFSLSIIPETPGFLLFSEEI